MNLNLLLAMPGLLFLKSMALLVMTFFVPYWALFYHDKYESLVVANPWIICVRKQCNFIKNIGQAEACRVTLLISILLSLPLGLSVPAQCVGILSGSLSETMPLFTSLICLIIGSTELLAFIFFRFLLTQLNFLLREFSMWLNWPAYVLLLSSVVYLVVGSTAGALLFSGALIFHHRLHLSTSLIKPLEKKPLSSNSMLSQMPLDSKKPESPGTLKVFWIPKPTEPPLSPVPSESASKPQNFKTSFSHISNRSGIFEQPWVSPNPRTSSYPLGFRVQSFL